MKGPLAVGMLLLSALPARAQEPAAAEEFQLAWGLHGGLVKAFDADDASLTAGLHVLFRLSDVLGLEASLSTASAEFESGDAEVSWLPLQITAKVHYRLATPTLTPYFLVGLGIIATDVEYSGALASFSDDEATALDFHLGGGLEIGVTDSRLFFSVEVRFVFQQPDIDGLDNQDFNLLTLTVGLDYRM